MTLENLKSEIGDFAKDIRINLSNILTEAGNTDLALNQIGGIALASAYSTKNQKLVDNILAEFDGKISEAEINAAKSAAAVMGMNNIYYRFLHMVSDAEYQTMPAGLRMSVIGKPGIEKIDFELYSLAISAINGCGMCIDAHVHEITKAGVSKHAIQSTIKIAAVINATAQALEIK